MFGVSEVRTASIIRAKNKPCAKFGGPSKPVLTNGEGVTIGEEEGQWQTRGVG
jgi:hypothetical protein